MSAKLSPYPVWQILDDNGILCPGALLYTYEAGTTTPKATYTDHTGLTANPNPIVADAAARMCIWLGSGKYKFILTDGVGATLFDPDTPEGSIFWTKDYIDGGDGESNSVKTIAELRALTSYTADQIIFVQGYFAQNDGGGGWFYYNSGSSASDNAGTIIRPDSLPVTGRWIRFVFQPVDVKWFGAGIGGDTDVACQAAFDYADSINSDIVFTNGTYNLTAPLTILHGARITGEGATINMVTNFSNPVFTAEAIDGFEIGGLKINGRVCDLVSCTNFKLKGITSDGMPSGFSLMSNKSINLQGCIGVVIADCKSLDCANHIFLDTDDGLSSGIYSDNINIHSNRFENDEHGDDSNDVSGIYINYASNVTIRGNFFKNIYPGSGATSGTRYGYNILQYGGCSGLLISNNIIVNNIVNGGNYDYWIGIYVRSASIVTIGNNIIKFHGDRVSTRPIAVRSYVGCTIENNSIYGCTVQIPFEVSAAFSVIISGNYIDSVYGHGILISGTSETNFVFTTISNNKISNCSMTGINITYAYETMITGNKIVDINTANGTDYSVRSGIVFDGSYRSVVKNNTIQNLSTGHAKYGIDFVYSGALSKWIYSDNIFIAMETGNYLNGYTAFPYGSLWSAGDETNNSSVTNPDTLTNKFRCIKSTTTVTTAASNTAEYTIIVAVASPQLAEAGDLIGIELESGDIQWSTCHYAYLTPESGPWAIVLDNELTDDVLEGADVYIMRWRNIEPRSADLWVKGTNNAGEYKEVRINGRRILYGASYPGTSRGLALAIITIETMDVVSVTNYDIYDSATNATNLANALNDLKVTQLGILTSQGPFNTNINSNLRTAAVRLGLYKLYLMRDTSVMYNAYAAIFTGAGASTSNTELNKNVIEVLQDENNNCPTAIINCQFYYGGFVGNSPSNVIISGDPAESAPVAYSDTNGNFIIDKPCNMKQGMQGAAVASTTNMTLGTDGTVFEITGTAVIALMSAAGLSDGTVRYIFLTAGSTISPSQTPSGNYLPFFNDNGGAVVGPGRVIYVLMTRNSVRGWYMFAQITSGS